MWAMADLTPPADPSYLPPPPNRARQSLFWPVVLIGVGVVALLFNTGWLDWDKVARLFQLWPLLLIALGLAIIFRGRLPARLMSLFGAILVILLVIALGGAIAGIPRAFSGSSGPVVTSHFSAAAGEGTAPPPHLSPRAPHINTHPRSTGVYPYRPTIETPSDEKPQVTLDTTTGTLHVNLPGRSGFRWGTVNDHRSVDLTLDDQLPWAIGLN